MEPKPVGPMLIPGDITLAQWKISSQCLPKN